MSGTRTAEQRFLSKVRTGSACWEWLAYRDTHGYGRFAVGTKMVGAHRFSYELFRGPIPPDLQIDHLCRNRGCVNPDHLELVTPRVNLLRGNSLQAINAVKQYCKSGHPFDETNTRFDHGGRRCRACQARWGAEFKARRRAVTA